MEAVVSATGSFAEESARLLAAFQEWAAKGRMAAKDLAGQEDSAGSPSGQPGQAEQPGHTAHGPECAFCPICQGLALLRGAKPEVVDHLTDAMTSLAAAVSSLLSPEAEPTEKRTTERVQHIDVFGDEAGGARGTGS
jgi:hypothetical protein